MLPKNIFIIKKVISLLSIIFLLSSLITFFVPTKVKASYDSKFKNYPGYQELIEELQKAHPNWEFEIYETGLNWNEVIVAESTGHHGANVVPKSKGSAWKCSCGRIVESNWACASTAAVAYYMDPRNSLNEDYIFQFEQLTYDSKVQNSTGVAQILADCNYMQGKIKYYDSNGNKKTIDKTYIDVIMEAAEEYNISPYHIASRIRQEQGTGNGSVMITGTYNGYRGLYNYYNIDAFGSNIIANGLTSARDRGWTDPEKAIKGGAALIAEKYISSGQDTSYFQKFNVVSKNNLYGHQYMANVSAPKTESEEVREAYRKMGMINEKSTIKFKIPVYKNMPEGRASMPGMEKIVTQDVQVTENDVIVRNGKGTNYSIVTTLKKGSKILRIELDNTKSSGGKYWDKVVLNDGRKGYISREYLEQISIQSNTNEDYVVSAYTNFRNGPGTQGGTTIIMLLPPGQRITVVEKGKYPNVDGEEWYRVKLSDGTYGYVGTGYIEPYNYSSPQVEEVKVVCSDGLNIRKTPSTSSTVLKTVNQGTVLSRIEKDVKSSDSKYTWDKVTEAGGTVGYVARQDPKTNKLWIEPINDKVENEPNKDSNTGSNTGSENNPSTGEDNKQEENVYKLEETNLICNPEITIEQIIKELKDVTVKDANKNVKTSGNLATGWTITYKEKDYTIVVLGDINGDGKVNTGDTLCISQHIENFKQITVQNYLKAADINMDGKINTGDSLALRQHVEDFRKITL